MKLLFASIFILNSTLLFSQNRDSFFARKWKSYDDDYIFFHYLKLEKDGSGIKAIGTTLNKKDKIKTEDKSHLIIENWFLKQDTLILFFKKKPTPDSFIVKKNSKIQFEAFGKHSVYPVLSKDRIIQTKTYEDYNVLESYYIPNQCFKNGDPFKIKKHNKTLNKAQYSGFENLIQQIASCFDFQYVFSFYDPQYNLLIPKELKKSSIGATSTSFTYSFFLKNDSIKTTIAIHYNFYDGIRRNFQSSDGEIKPDVKCITCNGKTLYLFKNWQGLNAGEVVYSKYLSIAYYTNEKDKEKQLQKCIASLKNKKR